MKKILLIIIIAISTLCALIYCKVGNQSSKNLKEQDTSEDTRLMLSLPVNGLEQYKSSKSRVHLSIFIPEDFISVIPFEQAIKEEMLEFIPQTDATVDAWSEIITVHKFTGRSIPATKLTEHIQQSIQQQGQHVFIFESKNQQHSHYSESFFLIKYMIHGRTEILAGKYFSGPYDCSGLQYAIAVNDTMTEQMALQKIKKIMTNNVNIVNF